MSGTNGIGQLRLRWGGAAFITPAEGMPSGKGRRRERQQ
jgi:hypothetical protein